MKTYISENSLDPKQKEFRKFVSKHTDAFVQWEMLSRADDEDFTEIPIEDFLDMIARDSIWYTTFLNNIKVRLTK